MAWQKISGGGNADCPVRWTKFVDIDAARKFISNLAYFVGLEADPATAITSLPYADREARTSDLFGELRGLYIAIDMDPYDAWPYSPDRLACDAGNDDVPGLYYGIGKDNDTALPMPETWRVAARQALSRTWNLDGWEADGQIVRIDCYPRVDFLVRHWNEAGTPTRPISILRMQPDVQNTAVPVLKDSVSDGVGVSAIGELAYMDSVRLTEGGSGNDQSGTPNGDAWAGFGWVYNGEQTHDVLGHGWIRRFAVTMPLSASWELAIGCARKILATGSLTTVIDNSVAWGVKRNFGLIRAVGGAHAGESALAQIDPQNMAAGANQDAQSTAHDFQLGLKPLASIPVIGKVFDVLSSIVTLVTPHYTAVPFYDVWSRVEPYLMQPSFHGRPSDPGMVGAPTRAADVAHDFPVVAHRFMFLGDIDLSQTLLLSAPPVLLTTLALGSNPAVVTVTAHDTAAMQGSGTASTGMSTTSTWLLAGGIGTALIFGGLYAWKRQQGKNR